MFGFLGVGQAGGNIANYAAKVGFRSIAINYSERDLESLDAVNRKLKLVGSEGVGKKREDAIGFMANNIEMIQEFIINNFSTPAVEVIVVCFSTGGGTGSGISPLLIELLTSIMPNKVVVACPIIPDTSESPISQYNTIKTSEELSELDVAVFPIDNHKVHRHFGKNQLYKVVNEEVVSLFSKIFNYTEKHSSDGVLDKKDLLEIFKTKGVGLIADIDLTTVHNNFHISDDSIAANIQKSWNESIFISPEDKKVISAGVIFDAQEALMEFVSHKKIFSFFNSDPTFLYEGNYHEQKGKVVTILAGLSWYNSRLATIEKIVKEKQLSVNPFEEQESYKSNANIDLFSAKSKKPKNKKSPLEILSKYQR